MDRPTIFNLLDCSGITPDPQREHFQTLLETPGVRLERIVSHGQADPADVWYDQDGDEWVLLLSGAARLQLEGEPEIRLSPGDSLWLPAHRRHRVAWTDPHRPTVWLALHLPAVQ